MREVLQVVHVLDVQRRVKVDGEHGGGRGPGIGGRNVVEGDLLLHEDIDRVARHEAHNKERERGD